MIAVWLACFCLSSLKLGGQPAIFHWTSPVKERVVTFYAEPNGKAPESMAVMVVADKNEAELLKRQAEWHAEFRTNHNLPRTKPFPFGTNDPGPDFSKAIWVPFKTNVTVDLGPGDGGRWLWRCFKRSGDRPFWDSSHIVVQSSPPVIVITSENITSRPMIQLKGYCSTALARPLRYELSNQNGIITARGQGLVNDSFYDMGLGEFTTNYFTCYDIDLNPGTNTFVLHAEDRAGYSVATNFTCVFTIAGKTNPPVFRLDWPQEGMTINNSNFDLRGPCDDPTAQVTALVCDDTGNSTRLNGQLERNGYVWVEQIPLVKGMTYITVFATDAAGNSGMTNITVGRGSELFYTDTIAWPHGMWQPHVTITGYYSRTNDSVIVNGVKAKIKPDGHWVAENVATMAPNENGPFLLDIKTDPHDEKIAPSQIWQPTFLGQATNGLQVGIFFVPVGTNEFNHYSFCVGITNSSGTNQPRNWMLPNTENRIAFRLLDREDRPLALSPNFQKTEKPLPENLSIHHMGKEELANVDGVIPLMTNMGARIGIFKLDKYFHMPPPGDYRLEVQASLFQIAADGLLVPVNFPLVTADMKVIDQPTEMVFYLRDLKRQHKLFWGTISNSLRVGVAYDLTKGLYGKGNVIEIFLENTSTNATPMLRLPLLEEQYDISLIDANGTEVSKTALGKQRGRPLTIVRNATPAVLEQFGRLARAYLGLVNPRRSRVLRPVMLSARDAVGLGSINLNEIFEIKSPGKYRLTYQQRLLQLGPTNNPVGITMPIVVVPIEIF